MSMFITFTWRHPTLSSRGLARAAGLKAARGLKGPRRPEAAHSAEGTSGHPRGTPGHPRGSRSSALGSRPSRCATRSSTRQGLPARQQGRPAAAVCRLWVCQPAKARKPHCNPKRRQDLRVCQGSAASPDLPFMGPPFRRCGSRLRTPRVHARCAFGLRQRLALHALKRSKARA